MLGRFDQRKQNKQSGAFMALFDRLRRNIRDNQSKEQALADLRAVQSRRNLEAVAAQARRYTELVTSVLVEFARVVDDARPAIVTTDSNEAGTSWSLDYSGDGDKIGNSTATLWLGREDSEGVCYLPVPKDQRRPGLKQYSEAKAQLNPSSLVDALDRLYRAQIGLK
jgi:hypothetical protein